MMAYVKSVRTDSEENKAEFHRTSSLNKYFICHYCNKKITTKHGMQRHVLICLSDRTCRWCKIVFKNRGNLVTHAFYIHDDKTAKSADINNTCIICAKNFANNAGLKYHIRREHYNLKAKIPLCITKKVNEVWFEKVLNSESFVEIKKVSRNLLLIRKCEDQIPETIQECEQILDLSEFYPTGKRSPLITCDICKMKVLKRTFKKHFDERHSKVQRHHCEVCNTSFKRSYFFARHQCNKPKKRYKRRKNNNISKIESSTPILILD